MTFISWAMYELGRAKRRFAYYLKRTEHFTLSFPKCIQGLLQQRATRYVMDPLYYLQGYPNAKVEYVFGDVTPLPDVHYVQVADDFSNLEHKLDFFEAHPEEALHIVENAKRHVSQTLDEDLLCRQVLQRCINLSKDIA